MKKKLLVSMLAAAVAASALTGCGIADSNHTEKSSAKTVKLDPENPVSLTVWHYYNGLQQTAVDNLVDEFNNTVGKDEGISVKSYSQGSVADLEKAITDAADGLVGADEMPYIFSSMQMWLIPLRKNPDWQICLSILQKRNCRNMWIPISRRDILRGTKPCISFL